MLKGMKGLLASLFLMGLITVPAVAQDDLEALFDEGVSLYNRGRYDEALNAFQSVLAENPSHELAFKLWNKTGHQIFLKMLIQSGEYESVAKRFIELAKVGRKEKEEDGSRIEELVSQVVGGDQRQRTEALLALTADHGEYTTEYMYGFLASEDIEARVNAMTAMARMGEEVVLPLIEVMHSDDAMIRRNAAAVLGNIGDARAVPGLAKMASLDEDEMNRKVAAAGFGKIVGGGAANLSAPAGLYLAMAMAYINRDDNVLKPYLQSRVIWKWREGALTKSPVAAGLYNLKLAEEACYQALACEPGAQQALALLAFTYAAQKAEVDAARKAMGNDEDMMGEELVTAAVNLQAAPRVVALTGPAALNQALVFALNGRYNLAAVKLIDIMSEAGVQGGAVQEALGNDDKLVRYSAALALAKAGVHTPEVVNTLVSALQESAIRQVLVIDNLSDSRNALCTDLNGAGHFAVYAENGALGLLRAKSYPMKDLVIMRAGLDDITIDKLVFELASGDTAEVPVMILAGEEELESVKSVWEGKVAGFISSPPAKEVYLTEVAGAMGEAMNPEREDALVMSARAGEALIQVDSEMLASHLDRLVMALDKPDEVIVSVLRILASIGNPAAMEPVKAIFADEGAASEVRVAAAEALGQMLATLGAAPDAETLDLLAVALGSDDIQLNAAAGAALGKATGLPDDFKTTLLADYRID